MDVRPLPPRPSAVDACARALREGILRGQIRPGERLPPERALATSFGVNRVTVRGALARLEAEGLVSARQGSGYTVHDYRSAGGPDLIGSLVALARTHADTASIAADLLLVRRQIARAVLERIAGARRLDTAPIVAAVEHLRRVVDEGGSVDAIAEADLAIARALVAATGSEVLQLCMNPIVQLVGSLAGLRAAMFRHPKRNVAAYDALLLWLARRDRKLLPAVFEVLARADLATLRALTRRKR